MSVSPPIVTSPWSRRSILLAVAAGAFTAASFSLGSLARKADEPIDRSLLRSFIGDRPINLGRIVLEVPEHADNNRAVPIKVSVESPMTDQDHVAAVRILVPGNADAEVATYHFTPDSGRARVEFRCRMARTSSVIALAIMSDGSVYMAEKTVAVTAALS